MRKRRSINAKFESIVRNVRGPPSFAPPEVTTTDRAVSQASKQALYEQLGLPTVSETLQRPGGARRNAGPPVPRSLFREQASQRTSAKRRAPLPQRSQDLMKRLFKPAEQGVEQQHPAFHAQHEPSSLSFPSSNTLTGFPTTAFGAYDPYDADGYPIDQPYNQYEGLGGRLSFQQPAPPAFQPHFIRPPPRRLPGCPPDGVWLPAEYAPPYHPYAVARPHGAQQYIQAHEDHYYEHEEALYEYPPAPLLRSRALAQPQYYAVYDDGDEYDYVEEGHLSELHSGPCSCPACPSHAPALPERPTLGVKRKAGSGAAGQPRERIEVINEDVEMRTDGGMLEDAHEEPAFTTLDKEGTPTSDNPTLYSEPPLPSPAPRPSRTGQKARFQPPQEPRGQMEPDRRPPLTAEQRAALWLQGIESEVDWQQEGVPQPQPSTFSASDSPQQASHNPPRPSVHSSPRKRDTTARAPRTEPPEAPSSERTLVASSQSRTVPHASPPTVPAEKEQQVLNDAPWSRKPNNVVQMLEEVVNRPSPVSFDDDPLPNSSPSQGRRRESSAEVEDEVQRALMDYQTMMPSDEEPSSPCAMSIDDEPFEYDDEVIQTPLPTHHQSREMKRASEHAWAVLAASLRTDTDPVEKGTPAPPSPALAPVDMPTLEDEVESISLFSDGGDDAPDVPVPRYPKNQQPLFDPPPLSLEDTVEDSFEPTPPSPPPPKVTKRVRWADQQPRFANPGFEIWREGY